MNKLLLVLALVFASQSNAGEQRWFDREKGRVEVAAMCGGKNYIFQVGNKYVAAKHQWGKKFAVGVPVWADFDRKKNIVRIKGLSNTGHYYVHKKYKRLGNAKKYLCKWN